MKITLERGKEKEMNLKKKKTKQKMQRSEELASFIGI